MAFTTITVSGSFYEGSTATPAQGQITFLLSDVMVDSTDGQIIEPYPVTGLLDTSGHFSVTIAANTDPTTQPTTTTYTVTEQIIGSPRNVYSIRLANSPTSVNIATLRPTPTQTTAS